MRSRDIIFGRLTGSAAPSPEADETQRQLRRRLAESPLANSAGDVEHFRHRATEAGAVVLRCASTDDVAALLEETLKPMRRAVLATDELTRRCGLTPYFRDRVPSLVFHDAEPSPQGTEGTVWKQRMASMDAGIGSGIAGLADAGAVIIRASEYESRSVSLLSTVHIVLLPVDRILPSMIEAAPLLRAETGAEGHSAVTIVGGPSKTADIEKVLVTGVHGPGAFVIVLIDDA